MTRIVESSEKPGDIMSNLPTYDGLSLLPRDQSQMPAIMHFNFRTATTQILSELFNQQTLVVITGAAGLGKTLLLREVRRVLQAAEWRVADATRIGSILQRPIPGPTAVLIDGPGHISTRQIQRLLRLENLALVLALPDTPEPSFRFCAHVRLKPLSPDASAEFVTAWLQQTGTRPDLLTQEGLARLIERSRGIPRLLASMLQDLANHKTSSLKPLSQPDVDQAAQRLKLPTDSAPLPDNTAAISLERLTTDPTARRSVAIAASHLKQDPAYASTNGIRRLLPTNPGSAALTGLLSGIGAAIIGLLLQDLLTASHDGVAENRAAQITIAPTAHDMSNGASNAANPSRTSPKTQGERP